MGKPFELELQSLPSAFEWAQSTPAAELEFFISRAMSSPLLAVGSGGSLSVAHFASALHEKSGNMSRAVTPLHLASTDLELSDKNVLLFSAGGANSDILSLFKLVAEREPRQLLAVCLRRNTPLGDLSRKYGLGSCVEYDFPPGKDGFLAVNSLAALCALLLRVYSPHWGERLSPEDFEKLSYGREWSEATFGNTLVTLFGPWGWPAAFDLESKCSEAGLINVQLSDFRNFGHGRHHWLAKNPASAVVAFVTPDDSSLARRTLNIIPNDFSRFTIETQFPGPLGALHLLVSSFHLVRGLGKLRGIDPGRPGVPEFGSRLYRLPMKMARKATRGKLINGAQVFIERKIRQGLRCATDDTLSAWSVAYSNFISRLEGVTFGGILFDYDGTLADPEDRFGFLPSELADRMVRLLECGLFLGVATGRGKSVRVALQGSIPARHWRRILVGYYNGGDVGSLADDSVPSITADRHPAISLAADVLSRNSLLHEIAESEVRPNQITFVPKYIGNWSYTRKLIVDTIGRLTIADVRVVESSHSLDIIPFCTSKLAIKTHLEVCLSSSGLSKKVLCIGDRGAWPGNDHSLLASEFSLSVDMVSPDPDTCWNIAPPGFRGARATALYLKWLSPAPGGVRLGLGSSSAQ